MSSIIIAGDTSGSVEVKAPAVAGTTVINLPATNGDVVTTGDVGTVTPNMLSQKMVAYTAVSTASGTQFTFSNIPSWVKRISVLLDRVSTNGASPILIRIGDGTLATSGYVGNSSDITTTVATTSFTDGFRIGSSMAASQSKSGIIHLECIYANMWMLSGTLTRTNDACSITMAGQKELTSTLDRIQLTTSNGTDTFDGGAVNVIYEG